MKHERLRLPWGVVLWDGALLFRGEKSPRSSMATLWVKTSIRSLQCKIILCCVTVKEFFLHLWNHGFLSVTYWISCTIMTMSVINTYFKINLWGLLVRSFSILYLRAFFFEHKFYICLSCGTHVLLVMLDYILWLIFIDSLWEIGFWMPQIWRNFAENLLKYSQQQFVSYESKSALVNNPEYYVHPS